MGLYSEMLGVTPEYTWKRQTRFGPKWTEMHLVSSLEDGEMCWAGLDYLFLGTRPLSLREECKREARMTVRRGLADVLEWLGETVEDQPTTREILDSLRADKAHFDSALSRAKAM